MKITSSFEWEGLCYRGFELPGDDYINKRNELKFNSE